MLSELRSILRRHRRLHGPLWPGCPHPAQPPWPCSTTGDLRAMSCAPLYLVLLRSARPAAVAALHRAEERPLCLVTTHSAEAWWRPNNGAWSDTPNSIYLFPEPDVLPRAHALGSGECQRRLAALWAWRRASAPLVVTSARAMLRKTLPPREYLLGHAHSAPGTGGQPGNLLAHVCPRIRGRRGGRGAGASTCRRGGIIDIFSPQWERPVRLELFGDAIDSLRAFDPSTQPSLNKLNRLLFRARKRCPRPGAVAHQNFATLDAAPRASWRPGTSWNVMPVPLQQSEAFPNLEVSLPQPAGHAAGLPSGDCPPGIGR